MAFLHRLASNLKDGLTSLTNGIEVPRRPEGSARIQKQNSRGKQRGANVSLGYLEEHTRDAIAAFVQDKFDKGECKPHVFTQFWLQFPKLEAGFEVLRRQLELRTGSQDGPLPLAVLQSSPHDFGLDESSVALRELCSRATTHKCTDIDFVGLVMLLLVVHLTEPAAASQPLQPDVRTMLSCLELAFTHFNSARRGKLDKREVAEALQYESAKAHTKEGRSGRTSNRLAHRLFEGLDWEYDNTITFENFLRGIIQLVQDEFGDVDDEDEAEDTSGRTPGRASAATVPGSVAATDASPATTGFASRRCESHRVEGSVPTAARGEATGFERRRSASATGMHEHQAGSGSGPGAGAAGAEAGAAAAACGSDSSRRSGSFVAAIKGALRRGEAEPGAAEGRPAAEAP